jgi:hypothetical protein
MASLTVNKLQPQSGTAISFPNRLLQSGRVVQTATVRTDTRPTYTAQPSGDGTEITQLRISITPTSIYSWIWIRYTIHYEMHHDCGFGIMQNSALIGYNTYRGNVRWSNILTPLYDNDYGSTPQNSTINWFVRAGSTVSRYYSPCVRSSSGGTYTFAMNRPVGSAGQDDHENGVSFGWVREIYPSLDQTPAV